MTMAATIAIWNGHFCSQSKISFPAPRAVAVEYSFIPCGFLAAHWCGGVREYLGDSIPHHLAQNPSLDFHFQFVLCLQMHCHQDPLAARCCRRSRLQDPRWRLKYVGISKRG